MGIRGALSKPSAFGIKAGQIRKVIESFKTGAFVNGRIGSYTFSIGEDITVRDVSPKGFISWLSNKTGAKGGGLRIADVLSKTSE